MVMGKLKFAFDPRLFPITLGSPEANRISLMSQTERATFDREMAKRVTKQPCVDKEGEE